WGEQFMRQASRIAVNRTIAGVHFPVDSAVGAMLGLTLGRYLVGRCKGTPYCGWSFDGTKFAGDFDWRALFDISTGKQKPAENYITPIGEAILPLPDSKALAWLWQYAKSEWSVPSGPHASAS